jgi:hypothetical protein
MAKLTTQQSSFSGAQAKRLVQMYEGAEKDLLKEYNNALLAANNPQKLADLQRNTNLIRQEVLAGCRIWCDEAIEMLFDLAASEVDKSLGTKEATPQFQKAKEILADNAFESFVEVDSVIKRRVEQVVRLLSMEQLKGELSARDTLEQVAQAQKEKLAEQGITGFKDAAGKQWNIVSYVEMLGQLVTREAMIEGTEIRALEHEQDLVQITDEYTSYTCENCLDWKGQIVSLTGKTPGYPTLDDARAGGIFHPNCIHNIQIL